MSTHINEDEPPPYSEIADNGSISVDEGAGVPQIRRFEVQTTRPTPQSSQQNAAIGSAGAPQLPPRSHSASPNPVESPDPSSQMQNLSLNAPALPQRSRPASPNPPPTTFPQSSNTAPTGANSHLDVASGPPLPRRSSTHAPPEGPPPSHRPPEGPPPSIRTEEAPPPGPPPRHHAITSSNTGPPGPDSKTHYGPAGSSLKPPGKPPGHRRSSAGSTSSQASAHASIHSAPQYGPDYHFHAPMPPPPPPPPPPQGRPQLRYPRGYFCPKCHNTGIKIRKGTTCQDCFERFGVSQPAQYLPAGLSPVFRGPPRVVQPGDPSIGGWLCGRCRGSGIVRDLLFFESTCPICHGVGRVF